MSLPVRDWTSPPSETPKNIRLQDFLAHRAALSPAAPAYNAGDQIITYRQLDELANGLAHLLTGAGLQPGTPVPIRMQRTLDLPIAIFGVLKAGGAILYMDPAEAEDRRAALLHLVQPSIMLTTSDLCDARPADMCIIALDTLAKAGPASATPPAIPCVGNALAQVLPTSGSTGIPKLVMRTHSMLASQLLYEQAAFRYRASDQHLFKFPPSFRETVLPSLAGGCAVVVRPGGEFDSGYLAQLIRDHPITIASFVPSVLKDLLREPIFRECVELRHVSCGGEFMSPELERRFHATLSARLQTTYTMTEADFVSTWECEPGHNHPAGWLGQETNMHLYVLDEELIPVTSGEIGEIFVAGPGLAEGYYRDEATTAKRFLPNPFGPPGSRLYRTGDLGCCLADRGVVYAGRVDDQVKIGGQRIDIGEVDTAILRVPGVIDAAAAVWTPPQGSPRLVAHIVEGSIPVIGPGLRTFLSRLLPNHMTPSLFVRSMGIPRLSNGKLNRRALPPPERERPAVVSNFAAPATPTEVWLARLWADALWVTEIGLDDSFFDLGGTSLIAMEMRSRINMHIATPLSMAELLMYSTVRRLAARIDNHALNAPAATADRRAERRKRALRRRGGVHVGGGA